ncbi:hypothetical protein L6R50_17655 [Myxococcota bacterium]|nr:hypothetical protein [Myxococcota bacterium]
MPDALPNQPPNAPARAATILMLAAGAAAGSGCRSDVAYEGFEQVIAGDFDLWPGDLPEGAGGEVWTPWNGGALSRIGGSANPYLRVDAAGESEGGASCRIPTGPGLTYHFDLLHRGGPGEVRLVPAGGAPAVTVPLPAARGWTAARATFDAPSDGVSLVLVDAPGDDALDVDDVSLRLPPSGDGAAAEPPILLVLVVHIEPELDSEEEYGAWLEDLRWLRDAAEARGMKLTVLSSGSFMEWALERGDAPEIAALVDRGHEVGTHAHGVARSAEGRWHPVNIQDPENARAQWGDARAAVDAVVGPERNRSMCAYADQALMPGLMEEFGFTLDVSSVVTPWEEGPSREATGWHWLGHHPHHPFRPVHDGVEGHLLRADPGGPYVSFQHLAQIGQPESHGTPTDLDDYRRQLGYLAERRDSKVAMGGAGGIELPWVFGVLTHLGVLDGDIESDLVAFLDDLERDWLLAEDEGGGARMRSATAQEVLSAFLSWEAAHPDTNAFSFALPDDGTSP